MELSFFAEIEEIGAASGIHYQDGYLYLIGDNSAYLYQFRLASRSLQRIQVLSRGEGDPLDNIPKIKKPDFESLCAYQHTLYMLGSGSTNQRNALVRYDIISQALSEQDLTKLYAKLVIEACIDQDNLNIEGAVFTGKEWLLFNRGNGNLGKNGIFKIIGEELSSASTVQFIPMTLLAINHVFSTFTDAVLLGDKLYFLATAEDTVSTYGDGSVLGSCMGCMDLDSLEMRFIQQISSSHKFEGITVYEERKDGITFLLCEDKDSDEMSSSIYKLNYTY